MQLEGKKALVIGLGKSGVAATNALARSGAAVAVYDGKKKELLDSDTIQFLEHAAGQHFFGGQEPEEGADWDLVVVSPGVPLDLPLLQRLKNSGVEIIGELELAYRIGKAHYIAITGTNGKTTTTVLTGEIFKNAGRTTEVVGNVGLPVTLKALEADKDTYLVTECSSYQLETTGQFHPEVSALLNLTPDHMDRHKTLENYGIVKAMIYRNQTTKDYFVINRDDPESWKLAEHCPARVVPFSRKEILSFGAFVQDGVVGIKDQAGIWHEICHHKEIRIPGAHNLENALAAAAIAFFSGIPTHTITDTLRDFPGVAHRMEPAGAIKGVTFINDSKGTNPDASIKAIESIDGNIILIAGGYDKKSDYDPFIKAFGGKVKTLVLMGKTADDIHAAAKRLGFHQIIRTQNMEESVKTAFDAAQPGDTVLLSPACASWDMYTCFEERGEDFKNRVNLLGAQQ